MRLHHAALVASLTCAVIAALALAPPPAYAFPEAGPDKVYAGCGGQCHDYVWQPSDCAGCHTQYPDNDADGRDEFPFQGTMAQRGPHGAYSSSTDRCAMCHTVHDGPTAFALLPGTTVKATCFTCHDGTAGFGVYGAISARGLSVGASHSVEATNVIPGADGTTGGNATRTFRGPSGTMTCSDCHSPHDSSTVQAFTGERIRVRGDMKPVYSTKLLKQLPTGATTSTAVYGSDWCMACHAGRASGGMVMNHPVDSKMSTASPYYYNYLAVYTAAVNMAAYESNIPVRTQAVQMGAVGNLLMVGHNATHPINGSPWFPENFPYQSPWLMTYPRSALHAGHGPICQQCHEDARDCGYVSEDGTAAIVVREGLEGVDADGRNPTTNEHDPANPKFQNFPHETQNDAMLVETGDNLCMNCHPPVVLP